MTPKDRTHLLLFLVFLLFPSVAHAEVLLVTRIVGSVHVSDSSGSHPASKKAFPLLDNQKLRIDDDAMAIILRGGKAQKFFGPAEVSHQSFPAAKKQKKSNASLSRLLKKKSSHLSIAASRSNGEFALLRPLSFGSMLQLRNIHWTCAKCGEQNITVVNMDTYDVYWTEKATGSTMYNGPNLPPGEYALQINEKQFSFVIAELEDRELIVESIHQVQQHTASLSIADQVSVEVALWSQADMPTEALYTLDSHIKSHPNNKDLIQLLDNYQE